MIAVGSAVPLLYARFERRPGVHYAGAAIVAVLIALGVWRSNRGNPVWKDNVTLFTQQVKDAPNSYRAHFMLGLQYFENNRKIEGERHYKKALELFPYDPLMAFGLAEQYRKAEMCEPAITLYRWLFTIEPKSDRGHMGLATCLLYTLKLDEAKAEALAAIRSGSSVREARGIIAAANAARDSLAARRARGDTTAAVRSAASSSR
jgi:tetratricopeptide (TPR) repeat protein